MANDGFITEDDVTRYANSDGTLRLWEQNIEGSTYYFDETGRMYKGLLKYQRDGKYRYFQKNGSMAKNGFINENGITRYANKNGVILQWEQTISGKTYYFDETGVMYKGLLKYVKDGEYRYFKSNGIKAINEWIIENQISRYYDENGIMVRNKKIRIDGLEYKFDDKGFIDSWLKDKDGYFYYYSAGLPQTGWVNIGNQKYFFNDLGQRIGNGPVKKVIDISEHNGDIDWKKVKNNGNIDRVILRIGFGDVREDYQLERNISELKKYEIPFDFYLYSYAENKEQAISEANFTLSILEKYGIDKSTHIYYDIEKPSYLDGRDVNISPAQYKTIIPIYLNQLKVKGYTNASVYTYTSYLFEKKSGFGGDYNLMKYVDWIAQYGNHVKYGNNGVTETDFKGWQYTSREKINGITGNVDISVFF